MKIGIWDLDNTGHGNIALMKISYWYKNQGDRVKWYYPIEHGSYDKVYVSSVFDFTPKSYVMDDMICGGSGFDKSIKLPECMDKSELDYSLYPNLDYSIITFTRGCPRKCPFCIVQSELEPIDTLTINPSGKYIKIQDDNFLIDRFDYKMNWIEKQGQPVEMVNIDIRLLTEEKAKRIALLKHYKSIKMAWDNPKDDLFDKFKKAVEIIGKEKIMRYVLVGYWSNEKEDLERILSLDMIGINPFVMPYNKKDKYQRRLARWCNHKAIFKSVNWGDCK